MEIHQSWKVRLSFKNATILFTLLNVMAALILLLGFLSYSSSSSSSRNKLSSNQLSSDQLKYIKESEELRLAMQPLGLINRVREIQQEAYIEPETVVLKEAKQTAALDLSKRLKDLHSANDAASFKALEEWRKRKMERAKQREQEKNGTTSQK